MVFVDQINLLCTLVQSLNKLLYQIFTNNQAKCMQICIMTVIINKENEKS